MRMKKSVRSKKSTLVKTFTRFTNAIGVRTVSAIVVGIMAAAILIGARQPGQRTDIAAVQPEKVMAAQFPAKKPAALEATAASAVPATLAADATAANPPAAESAAKASVQKSAPVTIEGCLQAAGDTFRLKNTSGVDAPKSRSWKSGFLKKGSASVELVDAAHKLRLPNHIGERVSVTGMLMDREMQVRSVQRVSASCN